MPPRVARGAATKRGRGSTAASRPAASRPAASRPAASRPAATKPGTSKTPARGAKTVAKQKKEPAKPKWTKEQEDAASKIQSCYRKYRQCKLEEEVRKKKEEMDRLMEEAERQAWLKVLKMEQEKADREHEKWLQEERERKAQAKRIKMMLESAFDGELADIQQIIAEATADWTNKDREMHPASNQVLHPAKLSRKTLQLLDCVDANDYTPLSEAAAGGAAEVIEWLASEGSNPNTVGRYGRTPLYRAAFGGHIAALQALLQCGADPLIKAEDGATPADIATNPTIKELLREWDVADTERLLGNLQLEQEKRATLQANYVKMKCGAIQDKLASSKETFRIYEKQLIHAHQELNKRIAEHDECVDKGVHVEVTLQCIHDAEDLATTLKVKVEEARKELQLLRLQLREEEKEGAEGAVVGVQITVRELEDVLIRDVGNKMKDDGRWPLLVDITGQASIFVRYSDTNYLNALNPSNMECERIRVALLGAVRFGKPLVIDLMGVDIFHIVKERFEEIKPGLLDSILDKTLVSEEKFNLITKPEDGPDYEEKMFWARMGDFKFWLMTNSEPEPELLEKFYVIRVKPAPPKG